MYMYVLSISDLRTFLLTTAGLLFCKQQELLLLVVVDTELMLRGSGLEGVAEPLGGAGDANGGGGTGRGILGTGPPLAVLVPAGTARDK